MLDWKHFVGCMCSLYHCKRSPPTHIWKMKLHFATLAGLSLLLRPSYCLPSWLTPFTDPGSARDSFETVPAVEMRRPQSRYAVSPQWQPLTASAVRGLVCDQKIKLCWSSFESVWQVWVCCRHVSDHSCFVTKQTWWWTVRGCLTLDHHLRLFLKVVQWNSNCVCWLLLHKPLISTIDVSCLMVNNVRLLDQQAMVSCFTICHCWYQQSVTASSQLPHKIVVTFPSNKQNFMANYTPCFMI